MVIKQKVQKRQERQDLADLLEDWVDWAAEEDEFDRHVMRIAGVAAEEESTWAEGTRASLRDVRARMRASDKKSLELLKDFNKIIAKETKERDTKIIEHKKQKNLRRRQRREERAA
jgi:uncharacterized HAD superfamily protein